MRTALSIGVIVILLAVAGFAPSALKKREHTFEERLLGAMTVVERTIEASSDEVRRIGLYAPEIKRGRGDNVWTLNGIVTSSDIDTEASYANFAANLTSTCSRLSDAVCWRIDELMVGEQQLVVAAQRVGAIDDLTAPVPQSEATVPAVTETPAPGTDAGAPVENDAAGTTPQTQTATVTAIQTPQVAGDTGSQPSAMTAGIQTKLQELGYNPGPADGMMGPRTVSAILAYQRRHRLPMDGLPSAELLNHLRSGAAQ